MVSEDTPPRANASSGTSVVEPPAPVTRSHARRAPAAVGAACTITSHELAVEPAQPLRSITKSAASSPMTRTSVTEGDQTRTGTLSPRPFASSSGQRTWVGTVRGPGELAAPIRSSPKREKPDAPAQCSSNRIHARVTLPDASRSSSRTSKLPWCLSHGEYGLGLYPTAMPAWSPWRWENGCACGYTPGAGGAVAPGPLSWSEAASPASTFCALTRSPCVVSAVILAPAAVSNTKVWP